MESTQTGSRKLSFSLRACLELMRPANIVTAFADILAGYFVARGVLLSGRNLLFSSGMNPSGASLSESLSESSIPALFTDIGEMMPGALPWLLLATLGLYGGGIVWNDVMDSEIDRIERPERPIPSGRIPRWGAAFLGTSLLLTGIAAACRVHPGAGGIALAVALLSLTYNRYAKHSSVAGPLVMGLCRGGNLLLGMAAVPGMPAGMWPVVLLPVIHISAVTLVSRGEVSGGSRVSGMLATALVLTTGILLILLTLVLRSGASPTALPFALLFLAALLPPFWRSARDPKPDRVRRAVKRGVLGLILLNSSLAATWSGPLAGLLVILLLPVSLLLARYFAVT